MKSHNTLFGLTTLVFILALFTGATAAWFIFKAEVTAIELTAGRLIISADVKDFEGAYNWKPGETRQATYNIKNTGSKNAYIRVSPEGTWISGLHKNTATASGNVRGITVTSSDSAYFYYSTIKGESGSQDSSLVQYGSLHDEFPEETGNNEVITFSDNNFVLTVPGNNLVNQYLIIGMRPSSAGEAVTIGSSQEIGANRQTLSGGNPGDPFVSEVTPAITPSYPAPSSPNLRDVFFKDPGDPDNENKNRWIWDASGGYHYLPGAPPLFRGVDWSGNVAVTSPTGTYSLQDINVFAEYGFRTASVNAAVGVSSANYFSDGSLDGIRMQDGAPDPAKGWIAPYDHSGLLTELRQWREYIRALPRDAFFHTGDSSNLRDLVNRNSIDKNAGGKFVYDVAGLDANNDGFVVIDIQFDGTDFEVNNSDWIIKNSNYQEEGRKLVIFRVRGEANMNISNSSIMVGQGLGCENGLGVLFVKVHPEEEFTSLSGSSDTVFNANNLVINKVGFWDLNTIGDAGTDINYGPPSDSAVYLSGSGGKPNTSNVNRSQQGNYTKLSINDAQGCGQFISPFVGMQDVRFILCRLCSTPTPPLTGEIKIEKYVSVDEGVTWQKVEDPASAPILPQGVVPEFKFVVSNEGDIDLTDIVVTDNIFGQIGTLGNLVPGASHDFYHVALQWVPDELSSGNVQISLCDGPEMVDWVREGNYFYYKKAVEPKEVVTVCLKFYLDLDTTDGKYRGASFAINSHFEAVQSSNQASLAVWGWSPDQ